MYEYNKKEEFIKEYLRSKVVAETSLYAIFKKTEPFEKKLSKDISEFNRKEILDMFKKFKSKSVNSLLNYVVILKHYSRWLTGAVGENEFESIGKTDMINLVDKDVSALLTREDIDEIESQLLNWSDKAIIELLWEGIAGPSMRDIYFLSKESVNFSKRIITTNSAEYPLTEQLEELLPKAFSECEIMSYGETMRLIQVKGKDRLYKERANARGIENDDQRFRYVYRKIQIFRDYLDIPGLTMKNLQASGLWNYLRLGMEETNLGLREFLKTKQGEILAKRYGFGDYWVDNICSKYNQYL